MKQIKRETLDLWITDLQQYMKEEHDMEMGRLGAEQLLHFVLNMCETTIYNQAIEDVRPILMERILSIEDELHAMKRIDPSFA